MLILLGSLPSSHKQIEPEIIRRLMNDNHIREISSSVDIRGLNLLNSRTTVGSLSENDEYSYDEIERFWSNSRNIRQSIAIGSEPFPGEMLNPKSEIVLSKEMLDLMVEYYLASYENFDFQAPFDDGPEDSIVISRITIISLVDVESVQRCLVQIGRAHV